MKGLAVTGVAAISPVGLTVEQTSAAIRAGVTGLVEHPYHDVLTRDPEWDDEEELVGGLVPTLDPWMDAPERLLELGLTVVRDLVKTTGLARRQLERAALLLALPPDADPVVAHWQLDQWFAAQLCRRAGIAACPIIRVEQSGHGAALKLIGDARELLEAGHVEHCVLVAAESYHHEARLEHLDASFQLRSERSPDGFLPGEAAAALLLERAGGVRPALGTLVGPSIAVEPRTIEGDYASSGRGLQLAIEQLRGQAGRPARWVLCDLNGESYRAFEWGTVLTRLAEQLSDVQKLIHPADCVGDVGAATGGLLIACALEAFRRGYAPADEALIWCSSARGMRAAVEVRAPNPRA